MDVEYDKLDSSKESMVGMYWLTKDGIARQLTGTTHNSYHSIAIRRPS